MSWIDEMQDVAAEIDETFGEVVTLTPAERDPRGVNFAPVPIKERV